MWVTKNVQKFGATLRSFGLLGMLVSLLSETKRLPYAPEKQA